MQKKLIALAVAAALIPAAAMADTGNVTVYGLMSMDFDNVRSSNVNTVAAPISNNLNRVTNNATRLGFKGTEDLGGGLKTIWQLEMLADANGNAGNGLGGAIRNSNVGLAGSGGTVFYGMWDTPFKVAHNKLEMFDNAAFASTIDLLGRTSNTGVNFNNRLKNSVNYWTPDIGGFQAKLAYGTDNAKASVPVATATNMRVLSFSGTYENDMLYAAYAYEKFNDASGTGAASLNSDQKGNRLVGAFKFPNGQVGLTYERLNNDTVAVASTSRNAWELAGTYKMGASNLGAAYVRANDVTNTTGTGAKQYSLRYGYNFSKRTEVYGMYSHISNDVGANYNFSVNTASSAVAGSIAGASLSGLGLGIMHSF